MSPSTNRKVKRSVQEEVRSILERLGKGKRVRRSMLITYGHAFGGERVKYLRLEFELMETNNMYVVR